MSAGVKHDNGKAPLSLISKEAVYMTAEALAYGAKKYSSDNYKLGIEHRRLIDAALRHLYQYSEGEDIDNESGLCHISHALASLSMLAYMIKNKPELDNRYKERL